jgi:RNA polymerase sigma-70 factor (family 1)
LDSIDIHRIKQGDQEAFKRFFETFYPKMMSLACRFVDDQTAKDLVQEVFIFYWEQKLHIEVENIHSFLFKCLKNKCLNHIKHQMVIEEYNAKVRIAEARISFLNDRTDSNDVLKQLIDKDFREQIEASIKKLPPKTAEAFRLAYLHDLPYKEIAEVMNISPRTVACHVRNAVLFLRDDLKNLLILFIAFSRLAN